MIHRSTNSTHTEYYNSTPSKRFDGGVLGLLRCMFNILNLKTNCWPRGTDVCKVEWNMAQNAHNRIQKVDADILR
jgi:hypothetical protein